MNVDPTQDIDEFRMIVLCAWEYYMDKSVYLEKQSRSMSVIGMDGQSIEIINCNYIYLIKSWVFILCFII